MTEIGVESRSTLPLNHAVVTLLASTLLLAGHKNTNHFSLSQKETVLVHITAADEDKWPWAHLVLELQCCQGPPTSVVFFFLFYSLSLWVPQGGEGREQPSMDLGGSRI